MRRTLVLVSLLLAGVSALAAAQERLLPSQARAAAMEQARQSGAKNSEEQQAASRAAAATQLATVQRQNLGRDEELALGSLLQMAGQGAEAQLLFARLAQGDDLVARAASRQVILFAGEAGDYAGVERLLAEHRRRFPASPDDEAATFEPALQLMHHYAQARQYDNALAAVRAELDYVNPDFPYMSFQFLDFAAVNFRRAGREAEYRALLQHYEAAFRQSLERHEATAAPADPAARKAWENLGQRLKLFADVTGQLYRSASEPSLVGTAAPEFEFTSFINSEPLKLADLRGTVVLIDFWANWCTPCKAAFPRLRALYEANRERGFAVIGVTGLQGRFADAGIIESHLTPERELALTRELAVRHNMTWPIVFSTDGCFDERYRVRAVPTLVLVDRQGIIRGVYTGLNDETEVELAATIATLLTH